MKRNGNQATTKVYKRFRPTHQGRTDNGYAYYSRASAILELNKLQEAIDASNKAIELDPNIAEAYETVVL